MVDASCLPVGLEGLEGYVLLHLSHAIICTVSQERVVLEGKLKRGGEEVERGGEEGGMVKDGEEGMVERDGKEGGMGRREEWLRWLGRREEWWRGMRGGRNGGEGWGGGRNGRGKMEGKEWEGERRK